MPIPKLNRYWVLPYGVHGCTLSEIQKRFGTFLVTDRRARMFGWLEYFVADRAPRDVCHVRNLSGASLRSAHA